jgi:hypothetical protein
MRCDLNYADKMANLKRGCALKTEFKAHLTLSLLMSYIYGASCKARNFNVVYIYIYIYELRFGNAESRLLLFAAQCFNIESMQKGFLCHSCV